MGSVRAPRPCGAAEKRERRERREQRERRDRCGGNSGSSAEGEVGAVGAAGGVEAGGTERWERWEQQERCGGSCGSGGSSRSGGIGAEGAAGAVGAAGAAAAPAPAEQSALGCGWRAAALPPATDPWNPPAGRRPERGQVSAARPGRHRDRDRHRPSPTSPAPGAIRAPEPRELEGNRRLHPQNGAQPGDTGAAPAEPRAAASGNGDGWRGRTGRRGCGGGRGAGGEEGRQGDVWRDTPGQHGHIPLPCAALGHRRALPVLHRPCPLSVPPVGPRVRGAGDAERGNRLEQSPRPWAGRKGRSAGLCGGRRLQCSALPPL